MTTEPVAFECGECGYQWEGDLSRAEYRRLRTSGIWGKCPKCKSTDLAYSTVKDGRTVMVWADGHETRPAAQGGTE